MRGTFRADRVLSGLTAEQDLPLRRILLSTLENSLEPQNGRFSRVCDYSGVDLSWAKSGPFRPSVEAIYPFRKADRKFTYHDPPNVGLVAAALNFAKGCLGTLSLPLTALWLAIHDDQLLQFEAKKRRWAWAYNATINMATMAQQCHLTKGHKAQADAWSRLSPDLLRAMLETLRTGARTQAFDMAVRQSEDPANPIGILIYGTHAVKNWELNNKTTATRYPAAKQHHTKLGRQIYGRLLHIAQSYGIPPSEFEYYLTIKSVDGQDNVFYPYHVLSRPQASQFGWDWNTALGKANFMVSTMEQHCNEPAVKAGYGEKLLDKVTMIYFLAKLACQRIVELSRQNKSQEWVLWHLHLDRWGLPVIPWINSPFKGSFCHGPDHGIGMFLGLIDPTEGEDFDPVDHIDLSRSTVAHDTMIMNYTVHNFNVADWDQIRSALSQVPLSHSFWNTDRAMGDSIWAANSDDSVIPQAPTIQLEIPMISLDPWFDDDATYPTAECHRCHLTFRNFGLLLRHYQGSHSDALTNLPDSSLGSSGHEVHDDAESDQDRVDMEYWQALDSKYNCEPCQKRFPSQESLDNHMHREHGIGELKETCLVCSKQFMNSTTLNAHMKAVHGEGVLCSVCGQRSGCKSDLEKHMINMHGAESDFQCQGCGKFFDRLSKLVRHTEAVVHGSFPCEECEEIFPTKALLQEHRMVHAAEIFTCECGKEYHEKKSFQHHQRTKGHGDYA